MRSAAFTAFLVVCCALAQAAATTPSPGVVGSTAAAVGTSPAAAVGKELVRSINECDAQATTNLIDAHALGLLIAKSMFGDTDQQNRMADELGNGAVRGIVKSYCRILQTSHGSAKLMRTTDRAGQFLVLVRFDQGSQGFDYLEFTLVPNSSGQYRVVDWYQLSSGKMVSVAVGAVVKLMTDPDPDFLHRFFGMTQFNDDTVASIRHVGELQNQGKYADALNALNQLPAELAETREILQLRASNAMRSNNPTEYHRVLGVLARKYGNDPSVAFSLIDYYYQTKQPDKLEQSISLIERRVGSDGLTNLLRANIYLQNGSYDQTVAYAHKAIDLEPDLQSAWFSLASAYVELKQYPEAVTTYQAVQSRFGAKFDRQRFVSNPKFSGFVQSAAFRKWLPQ